MLLLLFPAVAPVAVAAVDVVVAAVVADCLSAPVPLIKSAALQQGVVVQGRLLMLMVAFFVVFYRVANAAVTNLMSDAVVTKH